MNMRVITFWFLRMTFELYDTISLFHSWVKQKSILSLLLSLALPLSLFLCVCFLCLCFPISLSHTHTSKNLALEEITKLSSQILMSSSAQCTHKPFALMNQGQLLPGHSCDGSFLGFLPFRLFKGCIPQLRAEIIKEETEGGSGVMEQGARRAEESFSLSFYLQGSRGKHCDDADAGGHYWASAMNGYIPRCE